MIEYVKTILTGQFEAALCMMDHCIRACPPEHWEGKIANGTFRWVAYHTLFWVDMYLSPGDEDAFVLRDFHHRGGDERDETRPSPASARTKPSPTSRSAARRCSKPWPLRRPSHSKARAVFPTGRSRAASCTSTTFVTCSITRANSART